MIVAAAVALCACGPSKHLSVTQSMPALEPDSHVEVLQLNEPIPPDAEILGTVKIGDTGFSTDCSYEKVIETAREQARSVGGNAIKITEHKTPSALGSSCHRITAAIISLPAMDAVGMTDDSIRVIPPVTRYGAGGEVATPEWSGSYSRNSPDGNKQQALKPVVEDRWRFAVDAAFSYRIARADKSLTGEAKDFVNKMRAGFSYGADIHYFTNDTFGIGAKFSGHRYSHSQWGLTSTVDTYYFAPSIMWRNYNRRDNVWVTGISIGYLQYKESARFGADTGKFSKGGFGTSVDIGYDIRISKGTFFGLKFSLVGGVVNLGKDENGDNVNESLSAIEIGAGFRF